jgi:hypothetical protein
MSASVEQLEERFVKPLTAEYLRLPVEVRAINDRHDKNLQDAIRELIDSVAGVWELRVA